MGQRISFRKKTARRAGSPGSGVSLVLAGARAPCSRVVTAPYGLCTSAMSAILPSPWQMMQVSTVESALFGVFVVPRAL